MEEEEVKKGRKKNDKKREESEKVKKNDRNDRLEQPTMSTNPLRTNLAIARLRKKSKQNVKYCFFANAIQPR